MSGEGATVLLLSPYCPAAVPSLTVLHNSESWLACGGATLSLVVYLVCVCRDSRVGSLVGVGVKKCAHV